MDKFTESRSFYTLKVDGRSHKKIDSCLWIVTGTFNCGNGSRIGIVIIKRVEISVGDNIGIKNIVHQTGKFNTLYKRVHVDRVLNIEIRLGIAIQNRAFGIYIAHVLFAYKL